MRTTSGAPELSGYVGETDAVPVARLPRPGPSSLARRTCRSMPETRRVTTRCSVRRTTPGTWTGPLAAPPAVPRRPWRGLHAARARERYRRVHSRTCAHLRRHRPQAELRHRTGARADPWPAGNTDQADLAVAGPMARDVDDLELGLDVLAGPDAWHRVGYRLELPPPRHTDLRDYRIAVWLDEPSCPLDASVRTLLGETAKTLESAGARVDYTPPGRSSSSTTRCASSAI